MDLMHNFIADMPGPAFLVLYGVVVLVTVAICGACKRVDSAEELPPNAWVGCLGIAVILCLGGYKLMIAMAKGHTAVGLLIAIGLVGTGIICAMHGSNSEGGPWSGGYDGGSDGGCGGCGGCGE